MLNFKTAILPRDNFHQHNRLLDGLIISLITVLVIICAWLYRYFAQDDAFITYRYAWNIVSGQGFVYNLGEAVLGTTAPLYTLILALGAALFGSDIPLISHLISMASLWVSGVLLYTLGRAQDRLVAGVAALIFVSNPLLLSAIGMETLFLLAIFMAALKAYLTNRFYLTGLLLGLLALTRYKTVVVAGILGIHFLLKNRRLPLRLILSGTILGVWLIFARLTFGQFIPHSAVSKLAQTEGYSFIQGAVIWWALYAARSAGYYLWPLLVVLGGYVVFKYKNLPAAYGFILTWSAIYLVAAGLAAGSFSWYYGPLIPGLSILVGYGIGFLGNLLKAMLNHFKRDPRLAPIGRAGFMVILTLSLVGLHVVSWPWIWASDRGYIVDSRYLAYRAAADWLNHNVTPDSSLATGEIGVLGYYTNLKIIDFWALVTPALPTSLLYRRVEMLHKAIELYSPNYILTDETDLIQVLNSSDAYHYVRSFGDGIYFLFQKQ